MESIFPPALSRVVNKEIDSYFDASIQNSKEIGSSYERLWTTLYDLISSGGKRFRPGITLVSYEVFGGKDPESTASIAAAQELLHLSLLIHDDIIDRDYIRYGVPNIAGRYKVFYQKHVANKANLTHYSHSAAILAGDLMLAGAHELITRSGATEAQKKIAHNLLAKSIFDVAGGELLDTEASFLPYINGDALKVALYKTARYTFVIPLLTGAKLAHLSEEQEPYLLEYAESLGIAYQLVDDLLGVFGDEETTGKSVLGDIREGKHTFLVEQALKGMNAEDKFSFNLAFGNSNATPEATHQAKELLAISGGKQKTEEAISNYRTAALQAAVKLNLPKDKLDKLIRLATITTERKF